MHTNTTEYAPFTHYTQLTRLMIEKIMIIDKATIEIEFKGRFKVKQQVA